MEMMSPLEFDKAAKRSLTTKSFLNVKSSLEKIVTGNEQF